MKTNLGQPSLHRCPAHHRGTCSEDVIQATETNIVGPAIAANDPMTWSHQEVLPDVDGWNRKQPPGMCMKPYKPMGKTIHINWLAGFSAINSIGHQI